MPKRPGHCYSKIEPRPYVKKKTRKKKELVRGVPDSKIQVFEMGARGARFPVYVHLIAKEAGQIRHFALESARISANRVLEKQSVSKEGYHLKVRVYPHHVLRENKMMAFAGADRLQDGMRRAFGKPIGTAARVTANQKIISIGVIPQLLEAAKLALKRAAAKLPLPCTIQVTSTSV